MAYQGPNDHEMSDADTRDYQSGSNSPSYYPRESLSPGLPPPRAPTLVTMQDQAAYGTNDHGDQRRPAVPSYVSPYALTSLPTERNVPQALSQSVPGSTDLNMPPLVHSRRLMQQRLDYEESLIYRRLGRQKIRRWQKEKQKQKQILANGQMQRQRQMRGNSGKGSAQAEEYIGSDEDDPYESTGKFRHPHYTKEIDGNETGRKKMKEGL